MNLFRNALDRQMLDYRHKRFLEDHLEHGQALTRSAGSELDHKSQDP